MTVGWSRPKIKVWAADNGVLIRAGVQVCSVVVRLTAGITLVENNSKAPSNVDSPVHENMALLIVNEILKNPSGTLMRYIASLCARNSVRNIIEGRQEFSFMGRLATADSFPSQTVFDGIEPAPIVFQESDVSRESRRVGAPVGGCAQGHFRQASGAQVSIDGRPIPHRCKCEFPVAPRFLERPTSRPPQVSMSFKSTSCFFNIRCAAEFSNHHKPAQSS